ncbi:hypothetical protein P7K49_019076, partial [Saguinus oedipus]
KYKDVEPSLKIEEVDGLELVRKFSEDMETMLRRKVEAVQVLQACDLQGISPQPVTQGGRVTYRCHGPASSHPRDPLLSYKMPPFTSIRQKTLTPRIPVKEEMTGSRKGEGLQLELCPEVPMPSTAPPAIRTTFMAPKCSEGRLGSRGAYRGGPRAQVTLLLNIREAWWGPGETEGVPFPEMKCLH